MVETMKLIHFYALFGALTALQCGAILAGLLPPLSSYSAGQMVFSLIIVAMVVYMGWSYAGLGLKRVAIKGAITALVTVAVVSLALVVGYSAKRPLLGVSIQSVYDLPVILLIRAVSGVLIYAFFAVLGAWLFKKIKSQEVEKV
jgi:hypothetical protein